MHRSLIAHTPVTEMNNALTQNIDSADSRGMLRLLRQSDAQLFSGFLDLPSVYDPEIISIIDSISNVAREMLSNSKNLIVMTGCGTRF